MAVCFCQAMLLQCVDGGGDGGESVYGGLEGVGWVSDVDVCVVVVAGDT